MPTPPTTIYRRPNVLHHHLLYLIATLILTCLSVGSSINAHIHASESKSQCVPNIVFILADDLAWADLGCYGHPWHETSHLDQLAAKGMRFTDGYASAPICSASRASILTGKSTARLGFEFVTKEHPGEQAIPGQRLQTPPFTLDLPLKELTVAERLRDSGYDTAFFGKWHLNAHYGGYLGWSPTHGPTKHGFDMAVQDFGSHPYGYSRGGSSAINITTSGEYPVDSLTEQAKAYLSTPRDKPFFMMVSHFYVHTPVDPRCQWLIEKYAAKVPANSPNRDQRIKYGAFVETLDHYVGQLLTALAESKHAKNTLVVFTSDNGGHPEYTANGPLRGSKWNLYEGGIRVPFIAQWPRQIDAGSTTSTPVIGYDLLPTFVELAGGTIDETEHSIDGTSLVDLLRGSKELPERSLYWHFPYYHPERGYSQSLDRIGVDDFAVSKTRPQSAMRRAGQKLIYFYEDQRTELFDLTQDASERTDLWSPGTDAAKRLKSDLESYLDRVNARRPTELAASPN